MKKHVFGLIFLFSYSIVCGIPRAFATPFQITPSGDTHCSWRKPEDLLDLYPVKTPVLLSVDAQKEDLMCLKEIFEKYYSGTTCFSEKGISLLQRVEKEIKNTEQATSPALFSKTLFKLHEGAYDRHLQYVSESKGHTVKSYFPIKTIFVSVEQFLSTPEGFKAIHREQDSREYIQQCEGLEAFPVLNAPGYYVFVGQKRFENDVLDQVNCISSKGHTALKMKALETFPLNESMKRFHTKMLGNKVFYVRLPSTSLHDPAQNKKLLKTLLNADPDTFVFFDLRQNHGGSGRLVQQIAQVLTPGDQRLPTMTQVQKDNLFSFAAQINLLGTTIQKMSGIPGYEARLKDSEIRQAAMLRKFDDLSKQGIGLDLINTKTRTSQDVSGLRPSSALPRIVLLMDSGCGSNCEKLIFMLRRHSGVTLVGTHTAGALHFGEMGALRLPQSKIQVLMGMKWFKEPVDVLEGVGYAPDYYIVAGDPVQQIVDYLSF